MSDTDQPQETVNHTLDGPQDKAEPPAPPSAPVPENPAPELLDELLVQRADFVENALREKEQLMLGFVHKQVPKPYYLQWKAEANEFYALLVNLKHRRARQKAG